MAITGQSTEIVWGEAGQLKAAEKHGGRQVERVSRQMDWKRAATSPDLQNVSTHDVERSFFEAPTQSASSFPCPSCQGPLVPISGTRNVKCQRCGGLFQDNQA